MKIPNLKEIKNIINILDIETTDDNIKEIKPEHKNLIVKSLLEELFNKLMQKQMFGKITPKEYKELIEILTILQQK